MRVEYECNYYESKRPCGPFEQHDLEGTLRHGPLSDAGRQVPSTHRDRAYDYDHLGSAKLKEMPDDALRPQVGRASALAGSSGSDASRTGVAE